MPFFFFFFSLRNLKEAKASQIACGARKLTGLAPNLTEAIAYQPLVLLQTFVNNGSIVHLFFNSKVSAEYWAEAVINLFTRFVFLSDNV